MAGLNENTKLLLHCDGADESTTFTDSRLTDPHTVTANGTAQLDTAEKKWGTASGLFDGNSDYLTIPDSPDWDIFDGNDWTVDFWVKTGDDSGSHTILAQYEVPGQWVLYIDSGKKLNMYANLNGTVYTSVTGVVDLSTQWNHVAWVKSGNDTGIYLNGSQDMYISVPESDTFAIPLTIGRHPFPTEYFYGWLDEIRIQKSNYFNASPNATPDDTITVPIEAYSEASGLFFPNQTIIII